MPSLVCDRLPDDAPPACPACSPRTSSENYRGGADRQARDVQSYHKCPRPMPSPEKVTAARFWTANTADHPDLPEPEFLPIMRQPS